jgi:hypothetical protein
MVDTEVTVDTDTDIHIIVDIYMEIIVGHGRKFFHDNIITHIKRSLCVIMYYCNVSGIAILSNKLNDGFFTHFSK